VLEGNLKKLCVGANFMKLKFLLSFLIAIAGKAEAHTADLSLVVLFNSVSEKSHKFKVSKDELTFSNFAYKNITIINIPNWPSVLKSDSIIENFLCLGILFLIISFLNIII
jgi:hypothetical protein